MGCTCSPQLPLFFRQLASSRHTLFILLRHTLSWQLYCENLSSLASIAQSQEMKGRIRFDLRYEAQVWIGNASDVLDSLIDWMVVALSLPHDVSDGKADRPRYSLRAVNARLAAIHSCFLQFKVFQPFSPRNSNSVPCMKTRVNHHNSAKKFESFNMSLSKAMWIWAEQGHMNFTARPLQGSCLLQDLVTELAQISICRTAPIVKGRSIM